MKVKTCWSFILMNASIAACVNLNAPQTRSGLTQSQTWKNGLNLTASIQNLWPVIITKKDPLPEAEERDGETGKLEKYFSETRRRGRLNRISFRTIKQVKTHWILPINSNDFAIVVRLNLPLRKLSKGCFL